MVEDVKDLLDERDRRYQERFEAQERALQVSLEAAREEFRLHIRGATERLRVAYDASERAIEKAETASEKRFDAVNEFRAQQLDIITTLIPRTTYDAETTALEKRIGNLELDGRGMISRQEFEAYIQRVDDTAALNRRRSDDNLDANRRAAMTAYLAIGLAIITMITSILITTLPHTVR